MNYSSEGENKQRLGNKKHNFAISNLVSIYIVSFSRHWLASSP